MNRTETIKIMAVLRAAYPQYYDKQSQEDLHGIINLWTEMFSDDPYDIVALAVKALIKTRPSSYPPTIGEISAKILQITTPPEISELEAWAMVSNALRNSGYNSVKEFEKLPPIVQKIVGSPSQLREWSQMESTTVNSVIASNFQRSYKARTKNERDYMALPASVKSFMEELAAPMQMSLLKDKAT